MRPRTQIFVRELHNQNRSTRITAARDFVRQAKNRIKTPGRIAVLVWQKLDPTNPGIEPQSREARIIDFRSTDNNFAMITERFGQEVSITLTATQNGQI